MTLADTEERDRKREVERLLLHYEGLVMKTATMLITGEHPVLYGKPGVEQELEDVAQVIRTKIWRAIERFDPDKVVKKKRNASGRTPLDSYVFMCTYDVARDIAKKRRRGELHIEDIAPTRNVGEQGAGPRDKFDERYLSQDHDETFASAEDEPPELPSTLTDRERAVTCLLYEGFQQKEVAEQLGITKRDVESAARGIRSKLADRRP